jgi:L-fuconate dehydratase
MSRISQSFVHGPLISFPPLRILTLHPKIRFIEKPTSPDDILGHASIRRALSPEHICVATGEHAPNRLVFKQLLQADAIDVAQIDACRLGGVSEVLCVLLMAAKCLLSLSPFGNVSDLFFGPCG